MLLTLLSKTDLRGSIYLSLAIVLAWEDEVHLHAPQTRLNTSGCVCANCHLEKLHHC
jgi:hypothetical protein